MIYKRPRHGPRLNPPRRGSFIVVVVVCLALAGMLLASLLKMALMEERQLGYEQMRLQAAWLADSGLDRAVSRLAIDADYAGEEWNIPAPQLGGPDGAAVVIHVQNDETRTTQRAVVVEAVYPADAPHQARLTRQAIITVSKESQR